ncbi:hypothetical protein CQA09_29535, partial [Klebsiella pneumoniae]
VQANVFEPVVSDTRFHGNAARSRLFGSTEFATNAVQANVFEPVVSDTRFHGNAARSRLFGSTEFAT